jgi:hypothetical protein
VALLAKSGSGVTHDDLCCVPLVDLKTSNTYQVIQRINHPDIPDAHPLPDLAARGWTVSMYADHHVGSRFDELRVDIDFF